MIESMYLGICYSKIGVKYAKNDEYKFPYPSPEIKYKGNRFRVLRYNKGFIASPNIPMSSLAIIPIDKKMEEYTVEDANKVKNLYLMWEDIYYAPVLGQSYKKGIISFFESFKLDKSKEIIPRNYKLFKRIFSREKISYELSLKRKKKGYEEIENKYGKGYTNLLKTLDDMIAKQHVGIQRIFKEILSISKDIFNFFEKPDDKIFNELQDKSIRLKEMVNKYVNDFNKRIKIWNDLTKLRKTKKIKISPFISTLVEAIIFLASYNIPFIAFLLKILEYLINSSLYLFNFLLYDNVLYTKFGNEAVQKAIDMKKGIIESSNRYNFILGRTDKHIINNINEFSAKNLSRTKEIK
ncbi:MAG: hypothetical protein KKG75_00530 [Nanoarchaeota archaeon]|nr:hypothetical protein [Nanoarchaeota archaeon]